MTRNARTALPLAAALLASAALLVPPSATAAAGDLDVTFDGDGRVADDVAGCDDEGGPVVEQTDGALVVGGYSCDPAAPSHPLDATLWRFTAVGGLDPTFGGGDGLVRVGFPGYDSRYDAVALGAAGAVVAGGTRAGADDADALVTRVSAAGVPDAGFGSGGSVAMHVGGPKSMDEVHSVVVAGDGGVTAAGLSCTRGDAFDLDCKVFVLKLTSAGAPDTGFDGDGVALSPSGFFGEVEILPDGRLAVAGTSPDDGTALVAVLTSAAQPDATFAGDGRLTPSMDPYGLAVTADRLYVIGQDSDDTADAAVAKYDLTGALDETWGTDGLAIADLGGEEFALDGAFDSDGNLYVLGEASEWDCCAIVARFTPVGALETGFGEGGSVRTAFGGHGTFVAAAGLTVQADGKPVVVGSVGAGDLDVALTRYLATTPNPVRYTPVTPARIVDSRPGAPYADGLNRRLGPGEEFAFTVRGKGGIPATGVSAVVLNVTVINPTASGGYVSGFPFGAQFPVTSNLNFVKGQTVANLMTVKVGDLGKVVLLLSSGTADIAVDVAGWYSDGTAPVAGGVFVPVDPSRLLDTRNGGGARVGAGGTRNVQVTGAAGIPATGVSAVVLNLTVTQPTGTSFLTAYPAGSTLPPVSNLNFTKNQTIANMAVVKLGAGGAVTLRNAANATHLVADVAGWFTDGSSSTTGGAYQALTPNRILDTRYGIGVAPAPVGPAQTTTVQVAGRGRVPASATAVVMNVTAVAPTASGYLKVWPADQPGEPLVSAVNFPVGRTVPNLVTVKLSPDGKVKLKNAAGNTHVLFDVAGWYSPATAPAE